MRRATSRKSPVLFLSDARALATTVAWLRPLEALGQALAVVAAGLWLQVSLPRMQLAAGIVVLVLATPLALWRLRQPWPVSEWEAFAHLAFDMLLLAWALYFTGGASNPFITLLLAPVALSAVALPGRITAAVMVVAFALYGLLMLHNVPLPDMMMHGSGFRLHLAGMAVNFLVAALLLAVIVGRMRSLLNAQREATRSLRERTLRDEAILAIASQAADAAHRLNTPLSTLCTLLPELEHGREQDAALTEDVAVMLGEVERCRSILREMTEYGRRQLADAPEDSQLEDYVRVQGDRFRLLRPEAELTVDVAAAAGQRLIRVRPGLAHALLNLMQNAFEASRQNGSRVVTLTADADGFWLEFTVGDRGRGLPDGVLGMRPVASHKPDGLGIGLSLARSAIERMGGEMEAHADADGSSIIVRLPLDQART